MTRQKADSILFHLVILLLLLATFGLFWAGRNFDIRFEEIVFHLFMPLQGTAPVMITSYLLTGLLPALGLWAVWLLLWRRGLRLGGFALPLCLIWAALLVFGANRAFGFVSYVVNLGTRSDFIAREYADPREVALTFPEKKRNLITIFVESGETTIQDESSGGLMPFNYIPEMTRIARENISFSQSDLTVGAQVTPGAEWTMAALVAQTSGLPVKPGLRMARSTAVYGALLPGAVSLGDILAQAGYRNVFLAGSDFQFGGRVDYFARHGDYEIWDYKSAVRENRLPNRDYYVWWGFEDQKLYAFAQERLTDLAAGDEPFNFAMLTVDTHHIDGYVCELCQNDRDSQYANVWACASRQLDDFLRWIQAQDFYADTTVVIFGDHPSMQPRFFARGTPRQVYNVFINSAAETDCEADRRFTTLDFFPTTLASIGVSIEGERLGLGVNLFSGAPTLAEQYGYDALSAELAKRSDFYDNDLLFP